MIIWSPLMLTLSRTVSSSSSFHFHFRNRHQKQFLSSDFCCCCRFLTMPPSSSSSKSKVKIVAEYAKSNRSSCKKCSNTISAKALRLGSVTRDARGFDMTKWHHLDCFPDKIESLDAVGGFSSLNTSDQEALKKLVTESKNSREEEEVAKGTSDFVEAREKTSSKIRKKDEDGQDVELEERDSKQIKLSTANDEGELILTFSRSDVMDKYKDATLLPKWRAFQTIIFLERVPRLPVESLTISSTIKELFVAKWKDDGLNDSNKIAAFDFDGCLAKTSVKRVGADAWSLMYPSIPGKLQSLYDDGYKLIIFTNESNIDRWKKKRQVAVDSKLGRLDNFIKLVKVPIQVFIACGYSDGKIEDPFRKPKPGMWRIMEKHFNSGIAIDMNRSFYVGDAAGRDGDHSDADIKFAEAIGLKFHVPEDFFAA